MIRTIKIDVNAAYPQMPIERASAFVGSSISLTLLNVPRRHGERDITSVRVTITNAQGTITTRDAVRNGCAWNVTMPSVAVGGVGTIANGLIVSAVGVDENKAEAEWILGVGDLEVLPIDGVPVPQDVKQIVHALHNEPTLPTFGDIAPISGKLSFYDGENWLALGGDGAVASVNGKVGEVELTASDIPTTEADKSVQTKLDLLDDGFAALDRAVTSLGDAVVDKASLTQDNELKGYNTFQQDAWFNGETVSIAGVMLLSNGWNALTQGGNPLLGNEDFIAAVLDSSYSKEEVDDKITRFVAHYLTAKDSSTGRMIPFANHAALVYAKTHHTDENPQFFYAGEPFTPTKNDYCVVLADETVNDKTTRYSFVGEWGAGGSWQYQYTINDTAFSQAQWNAINSGITSAILASLARTDDVAPKDHEHTTDDITNLVAFVDTKIANSLSSQAFKDAVESVFDNGETEEF